MTLGDYITWGTAILGVYALVHLAVQALRKRAAVRQCWLWIRYYLLAVYYTIDHYVARWQAARAIEAKADLPDTHQGEPAAEPPRTGGSEPIPNRETLIWIVCRMVNVDGSYTYSANKIAEFVGGTRAETLAAIRAARGQAEPPPVTSAPLRADDPKAWERNGRDGLTRIRTTAR